MTKNNHPLHDAMRMLKAASYAVGIAADNQVVCETADKGVSLSIPEAEIRKRLTEARANINAALARMDSYTK